MAKPMDDRTREECRDRCLHQDTCARHVWRRFLRSFTWAFGARFGVALLGRIIAVLRGKGQLSLDSILGEKSLVVRVDAVRLGLLVGGTSAGYHAVRCALRRTPVVPQDKRAFVAGALAGLAVLFAHPSTRNNLALYICARAVQCAYNDRKKKGLWHFWGSDWKYGDALLFIVASAQVMYCYALRPDALPPSYYRFIEHTGPISRTVLEALRANVFGRPVDVAALAADHAARASPGLPPFSLATATPPHLPCAVLHPNNHLCTRQVAQTFADAAKRCLPVYGAVHTLPTLLFRTDKFISAPLQKAAEMAFNTARSTAFLSSFVALYMGTVCTYRHTVARVFPKDWHLLYWAAGLVSSLSILIEKKSRRTELALYVLPRAVDSLFKIFCMRTGLRPIPHGDTVLYCLSFGVLAHFYTREKDAVAPEGNGKEQQVLAPAATSAMRFLLGARDGSE